MAVFCSPGLVYGCVCCVYSVKDSWAGAFSLLLALVGKQPLFEVIALAAHVRPALSATGDDPVAGDQERNRVPPHGPAHRPHRSGVSRHLCQALIRDGLTQLHVPQQSVQDVAREGVSLQGRVVKAGERETPSGLRRTEVRLEPLDAALQLGARFAEALTDHTARGGRTAGAPFSRCDIH